MTPHRFFPQPLYPSNPQTLPPESRMDHECVDGRFRRDVLRLVGVRESTLTLRDGDGRRQNRRNFYRGKRPTQPPPTGPVILVTLMDRDAHRQQYGVLLTLPQAESVLADLAQIIATLRRERIQMKMAEGRKDATCRQ